MIPSTNLSPNECEVWVPHRISGFFQMMDPLQAASIKDPLHIGSRGGGPSLSAFVKTTISKYIVKEEQKPPYFEKRKKLEGTSIEYTILINGVPKTEEAETSATTLREMAPLISHIKNPYYLLIDHQIELPMGCGYGSSGAGAIGIAIGMNLLFNLGLSLHETGKYAHIAEVKNHTGLGTVAGQIYGGFSISLEPGYPFKMDKILYDENIRIVIISFGAISTREILTNKEYKELIFRVGKKSISNLKKEFTIHNFIRVCENFIKETQMLKRFNIPEIESLLNELWEYRTKNVPNGEPYGAGLNQLGKSVYCICQQQHVENVKTIMEKYSPYLTLKVLEINPTGPIVKRLN